MAAGLFAPQDVLIFKIFVNKPYTKFHAVFLGIGMAIIYRDIQRWKVAPTQASIWKTLSKSTAFAWIGYLIVLAVIGFVTLYPLPANKNPVAWSNLHNSLFISLSRPAFVMALMLMMVLMVLEHGRMCRSFFSLGIWVPLSRLSYLVYLIFPVINATLISSMSQALFLSYYTMFYLLAFSFSFCQIAAFFCHILFEGPLMSLIMSRWIRKREAEQRVISNLKHIENIIRSQ